MKKMTIIKSELVPDNRKNKQIYIDDDDEKYGSDTR